MIKSPKYLYLLLALFTSLSVNAQSTSSSPYSQFGIGTLTGSLLPQNRAMGGITTGIRSIGRYYNINLNNPASYSAIQLTTFDIGASTSFDQLSRGSESQQNFDASLSHVTFGIPVTAKSALSFGLIPYSQLGFKFATADKIDTTNVRYTYGGEGGVTRAYLGYGFQIGKHLSLGANANYLFGKLSRTAAVDFPGDFSAIRSRTENSNSVGGLSYNYGAQYTANLSKNTQLTIGYSGTAKAKINTRTSDIITRYRVDALGTQDLSSVDSIYSQQDVKGKLTLPLQHNVGFSVGNMNQWLVGADFSYGKWSEYANENNNHPLKDSYGFAIGGQIIPDITAVSSYFSLVDYRLGFSYNKTYININNNDIKQMAITFGLGLPLPSTRSTFYKVNFGAELGQRGTLNNGLVRERYANLYIGFTLNDKWFNKVKFD